MSGLQAFHETRLVAQLSRIRMFRATSVVPRRIVRRPTWFPSAFASRTADSSTSWVLTSGADLSEVGPKAPAHNLQPPNRSVDGSPAAKGGRADLRFVGIRIETAYGSLLTPLGVAASGAVLWRPAAAFDFLTGPGPKRGRSCRPAATDVDRLPQTTEDVNPARDANLLFSSCLRLAVS